MELNFIYYGDLVCSHTSEGDSRVKINGRFRLFILFLCIGHFLFVNGQTDNTDILVNNSSVHRNTEVHLAVNKGDKATIILGWNSRRLATGEFNQGHAISDNSGSTFYTNDNNFPNISVNDVEGDPVVGFNASQEPFMMTMSKVDNGAEFTLRGTSGWSNIHIPGTTGNLALDKIMGVAVDDDLMSLGANNVYFVGTDFNQGSKLIFRRLLPGNSTFENQIFLSSRAGQGGDVQVGLDNNVYVCWTDYGVNNGYPGQNIGFARSNNNGGTFSYTTESAFNICGIRRHNFGIIALCDTRANDYPSMAVDRSCLVNRGRIYICWANQVDCNANGEREKGSVIRMRYSDDNGTTWSNPIDISKPDHTHSWMPRIAVDDRTGLVTVAYLSFDGKWDCDKTNTYLSYSNNGGSSWHHIKVSDQSHKPKGAAGGYAGDYLGNAIQENTAYVGWSDRRSGDYQVFLSRVDFNEPVKINYAKEFTFSGNTIINSNYELMAKGPITMEAGASITIDPGASVLIRSETSIDLPPNVLAHPNVIMEIGPVDCYDIGTSQASIIERDIEVLDSIVDYNGEYIDNVENEIAEQKPEVKSDQQYKIYPNPAKSLLILESLVTEISFKYELFNELGLIVMYGTSEGGKRAELSLEYLPRGVYIVKINDEYQGKVVLAD